MKLVRLLRLLLEVYGAVFLLVIVVGGLVQGYTPYRALQELGSVRFYLLLGLASIVWSGFVIVAFRRNRPPQPPSL